MNSSRTTYHIRWEPQYLRPRLCFVPLRSISRYRFFIRHMYWSERPPGVFSFCLLLVGLVDVAWSFRAVRSQYVHLSLLGDLSFLLLVGMEGRLDIIDDSCRI